MATKRIHLQEESARCLLCADAPCSAACGHGDPARAVRAVRFGNEKLAGQYLKSCREKDLEAAERACLRYDHPVRLRGRNFRLTGREKQKDERKDAFHLKLVEITEGGKETDADDRRTISKGLFLHGKSCPKWRR